MVFTRVSVQGYNKNRNSRRYLPRQIFVNPGGAREVLHFGDLDYCRVLRAIERYEITDPEVERFRDVFLLTIRRRANSPYFALFQRAAMRSVGYDITSLEGQLEKLGSNGKESLRRIVAFVNQIISIKQEYGKRV